MCNISMFFSFYLRIRNTFNFDLFLPVAAHNTLIMPIKITGCNNSINKSYDFVAGNIFPISPLSLSPTDEATKPLKCVSAASWYCVCVGVCVSTRECGMSSQANQGVATSTKNRVSLLLGWLMEPANRTEENNT